MERPTPIAGSTVLEPCYLKSGMEKQHFERLEELYHAAVEQPLGQREAFLATACHDDAELRREVEALLAHSGEGVLDQPPTQLLDSGGLEPGARLGPYEIVASIGSGGMGEVYRARDTRLDRIVAIKVLAAHFSSHPEARERFEREARAVSSLNHPHICTLHDVGSQDGIDYLVMEYLEGETLASRLSRGALPFHPALKLAIQITEALEAAHSRGVVHRDLKPANVMLSKSGVKLLDFGLAKKALEFLREPGEPAKAPLTNPGAIMGTVQYMAPEQLEGKEADARTDIFSFGVMLYEMLTGRRAFEGKSDASIIAAIMSTEPAPASSLQPLTPPALDRIIRTCLAKDPDRRWRSAHDIGVQLQAIEEDSQLDALPASAVRGKLRERIWMSAAVILLIVAGLAFFLRHPSAPEQSSRFEVLPPQNTIPASLISAGRISIAPNGRMLAFVARIPGSPDTVWVRALDSFKTRALLGTEGAAHVFWSWDSRFIAFFADGKLKKVEVAGPSGPVPVQVVCDAPDGRAGSWGRSDIIVFWVYLRGAILKVPAAGGVPVPATKIDGPSRPWHRYPSFLPDGRHFLFSTSPGLYVASLDSAEPTLLSDVNSSVEYGAPGYLLYVRDRTLIARPFDAANLKFTGTEFTVEPHVGYANVSGGNFSVSENGTLAYGTGDDVVTTQMVWFDRTGRRLNAVDQPGAFRQPQITADGSKLLVERLDLRARASDIWLYDLARNVNSPLTYGPGWHVDVIGSADMTRIACVTVREGRNVMEMKPVSSTGEPEELLSLPNPVYFSDWSHDGKFALFVKLGDGMREDLWVLPLAGGRKPFPFLRTPFAEEQGQFSPDGKWIAYASDETGKAEVYVQSFPATGAKWRVSINGGTQPRWRGDGKEIFYLAADRKLMAVQVKSSPHFEAGAPAMLFQTGITSELGPYISFSYAVTGDGKRFLLLDPVGDESSPAMSIVLNWTAGLARSH
jgi:serine/threonine protein kinase